MTQQQLQPLTDLVIATALLGVDNLHFQPFIIFKSRQNVSSCHDKADRCRGVKVTTKTRKSKVKMDEVAAFLAPT
jgi:hypothetical protein